MNKITYKMWLLVLFLAITNGMRGHESPDNNMGNVTTCKIVEVKGSSYRLFFKEPHAHFEKLKNLSVLEQGLTLINESDAYGWEKREEYYALLYNLQDSVFSTIKGREKQRLSKICSWMDINININKKGDVINAEIVSGVALSKYLSKKTCRRILQKAYSVKFPPFDCKENDVYIQIQFCIYRHLFPNDNNLKKWPLYRER